jgi:hypothetical protein
MPETAADPPEAKKQPEELGPADIAVGIPSYNNADTIGHVVSTSQEGIRKHYASLRGLIVNSDGGSTDGTTDKVLEVASDPEHAVVEVPYPVFPVHKLSMSYNGIPGKGSAYRTVFQVARQTGARVLLVFEPDVRSITPEWVRALAHPILERGYDFVAPCYTRHKFDGAITTSIVYPLTRALYGKRVRQPIGGDFAFSAPLLDRYLSQDVWNTDVARFCIDTWVTAQAVIGGFKVCQAFLGPKVHSPKSPAPDLSAMLAQVVGSIFQEMERNAAVWQKVRGSEAVSMFGTVQAASGDPAQVDAGRMIDSFTLGYRNLQEIWSIALTPATLLDLKRISLASRERFSFPDETWVRVIYDMALSYHFHSLNRDQLLRALTPLYLGWLAGFVIQMQDAGPEEVERRTEQLCLTFEAQKPYLISRWRWPDRFNP